MKRLLELISLFTFLAILAVPSGAAFALEESTIEQPTSSAQNVQPQVESEAPAVVEQIAQTPTEARLVPIQQALMATAAPSVIVQSPAPSLPAPPLLITAYKASPGKLAGIQLYNNSSEMERLSEWRLTIIAGGDEYEIRLGNGWIMPKSYMVLGWEGESNFADVEFSFTHLSEPLESITLEKSGYQPITVVPPADYNFQLMHRYKSSAGNYTNNTSFALGASTMYGGGVYLIPPPPSVQVSEILVHPRDCLVGDQANDCYDFIKLKNIGEYPLDLSRYRLRTGFSNTSSSSTNTAYFDEVLAVGETKTLLRDKQKDQLAFSANDGTAWFEDRYGLQTYSLNIPPYVGSDLTSHRGQSWAYDDVASSWRWAIPSPDSVSNHFPSEQSKDEAGLTNTLKQCRDDQYRSEDTNRCRSIARTFSSVTPCKEGQYRSEATNRCRSITLAVATTLKPCADDQFRNPTSGRCKKIASAEELTDCGEGRERNPATNRCRNVANIPSSQVGFAVTHAPMAAATRIGWLVFAAIMISAAGYAVWEWRRELVTMVQRIVARLRSLIH